MQNMIRIEDSIGVIYVHFDITDGVIHNVTVRDDKGSLTVENMEAMKDYIAKDYARDVAALALMFKSGQTSQIC